MTRRLAQSLLALVWLVSLGGTAIAGEVYRCQQNGTVEYADEPCSESAERIRVEDNRIGGRFNQNLPQEEAAPSEPPSPERADSKDEVASTCRFINSTDLRRYLIRDQVVKGMTRENVIEAFGRPPETYPTPQETWVYPSRYYGAIYEITLVYFRDGCVEEVVYRKP